MTTDQTSSSSSYSWDAEFADGIQVLYSYVEKDPTIAPVTISYAYSDGVAGLGRVQGCYPASAQLIANNFPQWMDMRKQKTSTGQKLISSWACNLEDANRLFEEYRKEEFLTKANQYNDIHIGVSELSFDDERVYEAKFRNFLFNSSFSQQAFRRSQRPEGWRVDRDSLNDLTMVDDDTIFGTYALKLDGSVTVKQTRPVVLSGGYLTLSCYVKTVADTAKSTEDRHDPSTAGLIALVTFADGTNESYGVGFPKNTQSAWVRAGITMTLSKEVSTVEVMIVNRSGDAYYADLPMLEASKTMGQWTPSFQDTPIQFGGLKRVTAAQILKSAPDEMTVKKLEMFEVGSEGDFRNAIVPTRIEVLGGKKPLGQSVNSSLGRQINYHEEIQPVQWVAENGKIREKSLVTPDQWDLVLPRDLYMDENGDVWLDNTLSDDNLVVKAVTSVNNHLYVVTQETYAGKTAYYMKVVRDAKLSPDKTYLESIADIELPIRLSGFGPDSLVDDVSRIGICKNTPGAIFIDTSLGRRYYFQLYYDYYYADFGVRKLFCRENYLSQNAHLQVI